jgi:hypothetical protein
MKKHPIVFLFFLMTIDAAAQVEIVDSNFYHLRNSEPREWSEFPERPFGKELSISFNVHRDSIPKTLSLRQYDVKLEWIVALNGSVLGSLNTDEKDLIQYHTIDRTLIRIGSNTLWIYSKETVADDIRVGEIVLYQKDLFDIFGESSVHLEITNEEGKPIPSHVTILNEKRILQSFAWGKGPFAARTGHIYSANGKMKVFLPAGKYTVFAGRGFEYSIDSVQLDLTEGDSIQRKLRLKREVNTEGWVSTDTHIHTATHSGHGDASAHERVITLAGEGIELPIITDHNQHIDLTKTAKRAKVDQYFSLVTGNEVTSRVGHFNVFPIDSTESVKSSTPSNWTGLQAYIEKYRRPKIIILNHARDIHHAFRPHDASRLLSIAGQRLDGEPMFANAMEVINSGSQQNDWMQLFYDWLHLLNGGHQITPVGSSDSHDVSRFIVGQGRTYIQGNDSSANAISISEVVNNFLEGRVMVSCGLLTSVKINGKFGPGETAPVAENPTADIEVSGPSWAKTNKVVLYINGEKFKEENITDKNIGGVKWKATWQLPQSKYDYHVVAIAEGPGDKMVYWPMAKPYQPTSPDWTPHVIGASGAVWVDADGNGKRESVNDYAQVIIASAKDDIGKIVQMLSPYDESVAIQVAAILHLRKIDLKSRKVQNALKKGSRKTQSGVEKVLKDLKISNTQ